MQRTTNYSYTNVIPFKKYRGYRLDQVSNDRGYIEWFYCSNIPERFPILNSQLQGILSGIVDVTEVTCGYNLQPIILPHLVQYPPRLSSVRTGVLSISRLYLKQQLLERSYFLGNQNNAKPHKYSSVIYSMPTLIGVYELIINRGGFDGTNEKSFYLYNGTSFYELPKNELATISIIDSICKQIRPHVKNARGRCNNQPVNIFAMS